MLKDSRAFSGFSVDDLKKAREFYEGVLGLKVTEEKMPGGTSLLRLNLCGDTKILMYEKPDHVPATFTILNFPVKDLEAEVLALKKKGIEFLRYDGTDEKGITHNQGPLISWFKDPAGNFLSLIQEESVSTKTELKLRQFIPTSRDELFKYFTKPRYIELWSYPDGMSLSVPVFEAKKSGAYRFEHSSMKGLYVCTGFFKDFVQNERLVQVDTVKAPDGKLLFNNLESRIEFRDVRGGTEVTVTQAGFPDESSLRDCQHSWMQCFDNLIGLFDGRLTPKARDERGDLSQLS